MKKRAWCRGDIRGALPSWNVPSETSRSVSSELSDIDNREGQFFTMLVVLRRGWVTAEVRHTDVGIVLLLVACVGYQNTDNKSCSGCGSGRTAILCFLPLPAAVGLD